MHTYIHTYIHTCIPIQTQSYVMLDPNTQPGVLAHPPQMPVASPFPPHLNPQQSHPNSPLPQSPHAPNPSPAVQVYSTQAPILQPVPYAMPAPPYLANTSPSIPVNPSFVPLPSPTFQTPMSRLGYHNREGSRTADFPDSNSLDPLPPSQINPELFSKSLVEGWTQFHEGLQKQVSAFFVSFIPLHLLSFLVCLFVLLPTSLACSHSSYLVIVITIFIARTRAPGSKPASVRFTEPVINQPLLTVVTTTSVHFVIAWGKLGRLTS